MRTSLFLACAAFVLAGLWLFMRPDYAEVVLDDAQLKEFRLSVEQGVVNGPSVLKVRQGFPVRIVVTTDQDDILHLHGYELWTEASAGEEAVLTLPASYSGRFELEFHEAELVLTYLEVEPF